MVMAVSKQAGKLIQGNPYLINFNYIPIIILIGKEIKSFLQLRRDVGNPDFEELRILTEEVNRTLQIFQPL